MTNFPARWRQDRLDCRCSVLTRRLSQKLRILGHYLQDLQMQRHSFQVIWTHIQGITTLRMQAWETLKPILSSIKAETYNGLILILHKVSPFTTPSIWQIIQTHKIPGCRRVILALTWPCQWPISTVCKTRHLRTILLNAAESTQSSQRTKNDKTRYRNLPTMPIQKLIKTINLAIRLN